MAAGALTQVLFEGVSRRTARGLVLLAILAAIAVRAPGLDREITHDEAYSWLRYASISYEQIFTTYHQPNNHILHSALMRLSSQLFGGQQEWMLRAPAFVAGVAAVPVMSGLAASALGSPLAGVVAAWCLALHPTHISYSQSARGYSLLVLLASLSWWAALLGLQGRRWLWVAFGVAAFLATWTLPSGAILLLALGGSCAATMWYRKGLVGAWPAVAATLVAAMASGLAYGQVFDELMAASQRWGLQVWSAPGDSLVALIAGGNLLTGGAALASLALLGWIRLFQRQQALATQVMVLFVVPAAAALFSGVAGQPRSYLYLLPAVVVLASAWVIDPKLRVRQLGAAFCTMALVLFASARLQPTPADHGYAALGEALAARPSLDALLAPVYLDTPLDFYTGNTEVADLRQVLQEGRLDALLFACQDSDPRSSFASYNLFDDDQILFEFWMPEAKFDELFRTGTVRLRGLTDGQRVYPRPDTEWAALSDVGIQLAEPAFGADPAIGFRSSHEDFLALEATRFEPTRGGIMAATSAQRGAGVVSTLCEKIDGAWQPMTAYLGQVISHTAFDEHDVLWRLETRLIFVQQGQRYAICIAGGAPGESYVGDLLYTYFPLRMESVNKEN